MQSELSPLETKMPTQDMPQTKFTCDFSEDIWSQTYKFHTDSNVSESHMRVAKDLASVEKEPELWTKEFYDLLTDFKAVPGGRISSNAGTDLHGTTYINCFTKDAKILTAHGLKNIQDVKIGEKVLTHKGRWKKIVNVLSRKYSGPAYEINSPHMTGNLISTPEHPFYMGNDQWAPASNLNMISLANKSEGSSVTINIADYLPATILRDLKSDEENIWIEKLVCGVKRIFPLGKIKKSFHLNNDSAYVLGRYLGDGSCWQQFKSSEYPKSGFNIAFNGNSELHKDESEELNFVKATMEGMFGLPLNLNKSGPQKTWLYIRKSNSIIASALNNMFGDSCYNKRIPSFIWRSSKEIRLSFLLGVFDSDGSVTSSGELRISLANESLINELQALCNITNLHCSKRKNYSNNRNAAETYTLACGDKNRSFAFRQLMRKNYADDRLNLIAKGIAGGQFISKITQGDDCATSTDFTKSDVIINEFVYNLSVEEDESYVVNNVIVHNCFVDGPIGEDKDSIKGIFDALTRAALTLKSEGGYGFCSDFIRPRGAFIHGVGVETPGAVEMLGLWDKMSAVITKGSGQKKKEKKGKNKIRKGAMMVTMSCWHPDIEEFITAKTIENNLTKFNMSVLCTNDLMNAVEKDLSWDLIYPETDHPEYKATWDGDIKKWASLNKPVKIYKTMKARELWELIMKSTFNRNEPGVIFIDRVNELNNLYYNEFISASNPCVTGDTLIALADGRGELPIKQLAEEGKDVPVYCLDNEKKTVIRMMRNPRITGHNQKTYKITLDDGSIVKTTGNHKFLTNDKGYVEAKDLQHNDSLFIMTKYEAAIQDIRPESNSNSQNYIWLGSTPTSGLKAEHRVIAEFSTKSKVEKGFVVHHKDYNGKNNAPDNLQIMTKEAHTDLHSKNMIGDKNPMVKAMVTWTDEQWKAYKGVSSPYVSSEGEANGKYDGVSNEELKEHAIKLTEKLGRRFSSTEWRDYARENQITEQFSQWRLSHLGGSLAGFSHMAAVTLGLDPDFSKLDLRLQETFKTLSAEGYNCKVDDNKIMVEKTCEICQKNFWMWSHKREIGICSKECTSIYTSNKNKSAEFKEKATAAQRVFQEARKVDLRIKQIGIFNDLKVRFGRTPMRKEWEDECKRKELASRLGKSSPFPTFGVVTEAAQSYNHRVVSIEENETDTVYNGTVDDFHNFFMGGFKEIGARFNKPTITFINTFQCGEQFLPIGGVCLLGSLNLTQFINADRTDWDYEKLSRYIPIFTRMLDNVNDRTKVPLPEQMWNLQNKRRIGMGYLGYGSALYMMKVRYGSERCLELTDKLARFFTNTAYKASAMLAKEKGAFPLFDCDKFLESGFIKQALDRDTIELIRKHGIRNSHLTSIQPTGNSSIYANNISSGLEPVVSAEYYRTSIVQVPPQGLFLPKISWSSKSFSEDCPTKWTWSKEGDENMLLVEFDGSTYKIDANRGLTKETLVEDYSVKVLKQHNEWQPDAVWAANIYNLTIKEHIDVMKVFAKYVDSAMSKTINVPNDYPYEDFKNLYVDMFKSGVIKGGTTYRHGTMASVVSVEKTVIGKNTDKNGRPSSIVENHAPKRPTVLPCDIHLPNIKGEKWVALVGLLDERPYELFVGKAEQLELPSKHKHGRIVKIKQGVYNLHIGDGEDELIVKNIVKVFDNQEMAWATRMISISLRHGVSPTMVVSQLEKGTDMTSINKVLSRILKKYIPDGTEVSISTKCPICSSKNLIYMEGCMLCKDCGGSKCA